MYKYIMLVLICDMSLYIVGIYMSGDYSIVVVVFFFFKQKTAYEI